MKLSPVLFVTALLSLAPMFAAAQEPSHNGAATAAPAPAHDHAAMLAAEQAKADADLDVKLAKMEKARGNAKVALMADILKQLVAEHKANAATGHQHGSASAAGGHDMASCPMCASMHGGGDGAMKHEMGSCPMCASMHGNGASNMPHEGGGAMACPMMAQH